METAARRAADFEAQFTTVFAPFFGKAADAIAQRLQARLNPKAKNYCERVATRVMKAAGAEFVSSLPDSIMVKNIRVDQNALPAQDVALPPFQYITLLNETWKNSELRTQLSRNVVFVIWELREDKSTPVLSRLHWWRMPPRILNGEVRRVWEETKRRIGLKQYAALPKKRESDVCHIRPHGRNKEDLRLTPHSRLEVKRSFYLNREFIAKQLRGA